jgi:hypothetical protein
MILNKLEAEILSKKSTFDPSNQTHLDKYKFFLQNNKWSDCCPFFLEWPYASIPDMIKDKIIRNMFDAKMA